jgi:hypothetical protein
VSGDKILELLLATFSCSRERSMGQHAVVVCGDCATTVMVTDDEYPAGDLRIIEEQLTPCLGAKLSRALRGRR